MFFYLSILFLIVGMFIYINLERSGLQLTIFTMFSGLWIVILLLGKLNLYHLYDATDRFYMLLFMGIVSWLVGFFIIYLQKGIYGLDFRKSTGKKLTLQRYNGSFIADDFDINSNVIRVYAIIVAGFSFMIGMTMLSYLARGYSYAEFHRLVFGEFDEELFSNSVINHLYGRMMYPIVLAMIPVTIISLFSKKNRRDCTILLILILGYCVVVGRRFPLLYIVISLLMALPFFKLNIKKKTIRLIFISVVVMGSFILLLSAWRKDVFKTGDWSPVFASFYRYLNLCLPVGSHWVQYVDQNEPNHLLYGYSFFSGVFSNLDFVVRQVGIRWFYSVPAVDLMNIAQDNYIPISREVTANAFTTWVYHFYLDFRELGIIIGSLVFGLVAGYMEKITFARKNILEIAFYMLFAQAVFKSFVRWEFNSYSYVLAYLYMIPVFQFNNKQVLLFKWR